MSLRKGLFMLIILTMGGCSLSMRDAPAHWITPSSTTVLEASRTATVPLSMPATPLPTRTPPQSPTPQPPTPMPSATQTPIPVSSSTDDFIPFVSSGSNILHQAPGFTTIVSITFDDGLADQIQAWHILQKYGMHATFYIIAGSIGQPDYLTLEQLQALNADGNEIGSHTIDHIRLVDLQDDALSYELCGSRSILQQMGFQINSVAYPYGHYDQETEQIAAECGYQNARAALDSAETIPPEDMFALKTMPSILSDTRVSTIEGYVQNAIDDDAGWVILVFHHICEGCDRWSITPANFDLFLAWLQAQTSQGVTVMTIDEALGSNLHLTLRDQSDD